MDEIISSEQLIQLEGDLKKQKKHEFTAQFLKDHNRKHTIWQLAFISFTLTETKKNSKKEIHYCL